MPRRSQQSDDPYPILTRLQNATDAVLDALDAAQSDELERHVILPEAYSFKSLFERTLKALEEADRDFWLIREWGEPVGRTGRWTTAPGRLGRAAGETTTPPRPARGQQGPVRPGERGSW